MTPDAIDGTTWDQQLQLLAGQGALSNMSMAAGTPSLMEQFIEAGQVVNLSDKLSELGVDSSVLPAAESTIKALYDSEDLWSLPTEFNIEGFWYNKQLLDDNDVDVPTTWGELADAAATLQAADVQPFVAAGQDGWPITRLVGDYILRDLGPDALKKVADGKASLTDPEYVVAADAVAEFGSAGYFGPAAGSIDYNTSMNQFLTGSGAFFYMGSWALGNFNDAEQNKIGLDNIGFAPFPEVEGGAGSIDQIPANVGIPVMFTTENYDETTDAWVECVVENYGDTALNDFGQVTGFVVDNPPADQPALTTLVQEVIADAPSSILWFEAAFSPEGTSVSQSNGGGLATGSLSGQEFMELVQAANEG
nr:extracellular solute-binding protein [Microbacterium halimionae]